MSQRRILWIIGSILLVLVVAAAIIFWPRGPKDVGGAPETPVVEPTRDPLVLALVTTQAEQSAAIAALATAIAQPSATPTPSTAAPTTTPTIMATPAPSATPASVAIDWNAWGQAILAWLGEQGVPMKGESSAATAAPTPTMTATPTTISMATPVAVANVRPGFEGFPLDVQGFYSALQTKPCPAGSEWECKDLELSEIHPVYKKGELDGFEVAREDQVEGASYHSIKHFWGCVPWGLIYGYMSSPEDRAAMGFTEAEIATLGLPKSAVGAGIPGGYCGYLEGISAYQLSPSKLARFPQTVEERMPAGGVPWKSAEWVQTHFELNSDAEVEHQGGKAWRVRPIEGKSDFWACNPDPVGYDGYRAAGQGGKVRPGGHKDPARSGFPPAEGRKWCGQMQGFNAWPGGSW